MNKLNKKGFTLVELLTTITILGILMAVAGGAVLIYLKRSRTQAIETIASTSYDGASIPLNIFIKPVPASTSAAVDIGSIDWAGTWLVEVS